MARLIDKYDLGLLFGYTGACFAFLLNPWWFVVVCIVVLWIAGYLVSKKLKQ